MKEGSRTSYIITPIMSTSTPKIAPAIGVPKTVAKPALIPHMTSFFLSCLLNFKSLEIKEATPAPICAPGPSLPTEPPAKIVRTVVKVLTGITETLIFPSSLCTAEITFSVPCPSAEGANVFVSQTLKTSATGRR